MSVYNSLNHPKVLPLLKQRGILQEDENPEDICIRIVKGFVRVEKEKFQLSEDKIASFSQKMKDAFENKIVALGSPILMNMGRNKLPTGACTVIPIDYRKSICDIKKTVFPYYNVGMGSGFNLSDLEDPIDALKKLNQVSLELESSLSRPPAGMAFLMIDHPKIQEFIGIKKNADFFKWRFNLSVGITQQFMDAVKNRADWVLRDGSTIDAKELYTLTAESTHYCGEPGILFLDRLEDGNPTPSLPYSCVAPCAEIAMAPGEVCQFSYLNLSEMVDRNSAAETVRFDFESLKQHTKLLTRILDDSVEITIENAIDHSETVAAKRRIGIGLCGTADLLSRLGIVYGSEECLELLSEIMSVVNFYSKEKSVKLAKKRGAFPLFEKSRFTDSNWRSRFKAYPTEKVTVKMWEDFSDSIRENGIRNAETTALPPTGVSSRIIQASQSIEPRFTLLSLDGDLLPDVAKALEAAWNHSAMPAEERASLMNRIQELGYISEDMTAIPENIRQQFKVAHQVDWMAQLAVLSPIQKHTDESISKTVNCPTDTTVEEIVEMFTKCHQLGLKGITVFRDRCLEQRKI